MEFRKIFDTIPEKFDKWRPRYCQEAFDCIVEAAQIGPAKSVLEIGPGTGQATDPILRTGCDYMAIELGEHLTEFMSDKYKSCSNFQIVNGDFENYDFGTRKFDLIYSAATIQWIPEEIAFPRAFDLLKSGGTLAMMTIKGDYESSNKVLYDKIQAVYKEFFHPETQSFTKL